MPTLGPKVYRYDLLWAIWSPRDWSREHCEPLKSPVQWHPDEPWSKLPERGIRQGFEVDRFLLVATIEGVLTVAHVGEEPATLPPCPTKGLHGWLLLEASIVGSSWRCSLLPTRFLIASIKKPGSGFHGLSALYMEFEYLGPPSPTAACCETSQDAGCESVRHSGTPAEVSGGGLGGTVAQPILPSLVLGVIF